MIFDPKIYYQNFPADYHKFKVISLKKILENLEKYEVEFFDRKFSKDQSKKFELTLRTEIRQAYFHCAETLFEIINALLPESDGTTHELNILPRLTNAKITAAYDRAKTISTLDSGLDFMDEKFNNPKYPVSIGHFLFFYGASAQLPENEKELIDANLKSIKKLLKILASDLSDREEYNSYKHGLRVVPATKFFSIMKDDKSEELLRFDLSKSVSYYSKTKDPLEIKIKTKNQDTERDIEMTMLCSRLISNIIESRRALLCGDSMHENGDTLIYPFDEKTVQDADKIRVQAQDFVFSSKPIISPSQQKNHSQLNLEE